jgi:hypothetical protein
MIRELPRLVEAPILGGRIEQARWNPGGHVLELRLRYRDVGRGEVDMLLRYRGVEALEPPLPELAALVEDVSLRVSASRVHPLAPAAVHHLQLGSTGAIVVRFRALELSETLAAAVYGEAPLRFQVLSC